MNVECDSRDKNNYNSRYYVGERTEGNKIVKQA